LTAGRDTLPMTQIRAELAELEQALGQSDLQPTLDRLLREAGPPAPRATRKRKPT
jgi:hypothetical protein